MCPFSQDLLTEGSTKMAPRVHSVKARFSSICGAYLGILFLVPYSVSPEIELLSNSSFMVTLQLHGEIADRKSWACQACATNVSPSALICFPGGDILAESLGEASL